MVPGELMATFGLQMQAEYFVHHALAMDPKIVPGYDAWGMVAKMDLDWLTLQAGIVAPDSDLRRGCAFRNPHPSQLNSSHSSTRPSPKLVAA